MFKQLIDTHANINCYSKDANGVYLFVNPSMVDCFQMDSANDLLGKTSRDLPGSEYADGLMENDMRIMKTKTNQVFVEHASYKGRPQLYRSFKSPLLGRHGAVHGTFGISIPVQATSLISLSRQQTACLKHLALGLTQKQIAQTLGLAEKTIEHYFADIKFKLRCESRSELVLQAIERGLVNIF